LSGTKERRKHSSLACLALLAGCCLAGVVAASGMPGHSHRGFEMLVTEGGRKGDPEKKKAAKSRATNLIQLTPGLVTTIEISGIFWRLLVHYVINLVP
jgi:hypothetical protein